MKNATRYISIAIKALGAAGFVTGFLDPKTAAVVVLGASVAKDILAVAGDWLDDGQKNGSFKA